MFVININCLMFKYVIKNVYWVDIFMLKVDFFWKIKDYFVLFFFYINYYIVEKL